MLCNASVVVKCPIKVQWSWKQITQYSENDKITFLLIAVTWNSLFYKSFRFAILINFLIYQTRNKDEDNNQH